VENPKRTAEHLARIEERRKYLQEWCAKTLPGHASFVLEIGCGHGHYLTAFAIAHPSDLCVGIDVELDRIERAERKQKRARLANLHFLRAEAELFLETLSPPPFAKAVFILFPDPWPKRRHHKNRLISPAFLERLAHRCLPGARLYVRTDHGPYFAAARKAIEASPEWHFSGEAWPFEKPTVFQERAAKHDSFVAIRGPAKKTAATEP
jgi:tRNA (guanine-N7-)-methyltransferase